MPKRLHAPRPPHSGLPLPGRAHQAGPWPGRPAGHWAAPGQGLWLAQAQALAASPRTHGAKDLSNAFMLKN